MQHSFQDKNVLITGGAGFIGSNLARALLDEGAKITIVDSMIPQYGGNFFNIVDIQEKVKFNISDARDSYSFDYLIKNQHYLFNLAGQTSHLDSMENPATDLEINAGAQLSILESCRKHNPSVKIIFTSTRQLYGKPDYLPVDENHPVRPVDVNGINKLAGEWYHILYSNVYGIRACALRLTNTYGPGMRIKDSRQTFLGVWIKSILTGKDILVYGDGAQLRDFTYIDDCVSALMLAASNAQSDGKVFNLGGHEIVSLLDLAKTITSLGYGGESKLIPFPQQLKAIDIGDYYGSYKRIQESLGWHPKVNLEVGLKKSLDYYKKNLDHYL